MTHKIFLLLFLFNVPKKEVHSAAAPEVTIGGLFSSGTATMRKAFEIAVDYINNEPSILPSTTLKYIINETNSLAPLVNVQKACWQISQGVTAIIGPGYSTDTKAVTTITGSLKIPVYTPTATNPAFASDYGSFPYLLRLLPDDVSSIKVIVDIFKKFLWTRMSIISSNSDYALGAQRQFMSMADVYGWSIATSQIFPALSDASAIDVRQQLQAIKKIGVRVVFLTAVEIYTPYIMKQAEELGMIEGWGWIVLTGGYNTSLTSENIGLLGIRPVVDKGKLYPTFLSKITAAGYKQRELSYDVPLWFDAVIAFAKGLHDFFQAGHSLTYEIPTCGSCQGDGSTSKSHGKLLMKYLRDVKTDGAANYLSFLSNGSPGVAQFELVNLHNDGWKMLGNWTNHHALSFDAVSSRSVVWPGSTTDIPIVTKYSLGNRTLKIVSVYESHFVQLKKGKTASDPDPFEGFCIDLIKILAEKLEFRYTIEFQSESLYGNFDEKKGKWVGMVGDLVDEKYDLALSPMTISQTRSTVVDFSKPYLDLGLSILMKIPEPPETNIFGFVDPFSTDTWVFGFSMMTIVAILSLLFDKISPNGHYGTISQYPLEEDCDDDEVQEELDGLTYLNFTNSMWFSIGALLQQGGDVLPRSISGRTLAAFWWAASMIIIATYTANLAAFLTFNRMQPRINSVEQLGAQMEIKYGTEANSPTEEYFRQTILPSYNAMYQFMASRGTFVSNMSHGIAKARQEKYAFIYDSLFLKQQTYMSPCDVYTAGKVFGQFGYGLAFQKQSPLQHRFSMEIINLREAGKIAELENYWFKQQGDCVPDLSILKPSTGQLTLSDMIGVLYCVYMGIVLGLILIVVELCVASFWDVDPTNPEKPKSWLEAMKIRFRRILQDLINRVPKKLLCCKRKKRSTSRVSVIKKDSIKPEDVTSHSGNKAKVNQGFTDDTRDVHPFEINEN